MRTSLIALTTFAACSARDGTGRSNSEVETSARDSSELVAFVDEVVQLSVTVGDASAKVVEFTADGEELATCDTSAGADECRRGKLARTATVFHDLGRHTVTVVAKGANNDTITTLSVDVRPKPDAPQGGADVDRGFLDPNRALHNVFGGVPWAVHEQRVKVVSPPTGVVATVAACMQTYGQSIVRHADESRISRASVVATAITESDCTNPTGSSDGLSSGPMQVTATTCAHLAPELSASRCKAKMHSDPDFSFQIGAKYMGSATQVAQHAHDPPKIAAAYNAGSVRPSRANRWHMVVTGTHLERFVAAYNAYAEWEANHRKGLDDPPIRIRTFEGEHVPNMESLPESAAEGTVYFVGDWPERDGVFVERRDGQWRPS